MESLKQRLAEGQELQPNQLEKISQECYFHEQVLALTEGDLDDQSGSDGVFPSKASLQAPSQGIESSSSEELAGKEISDQMDGSSTRSSDDLQEPGYRLDWNDPFWESAEPPSLRFSSLPEPDEEEEDEEDEEEATPEISEAAALDGSFFMPVGFLNENQEYFPFMEMEMPTQQADVFLEPAVLQKVVIEPTIFEPVVYDPLGCQSEYVNDEMQIEQPNQEWSPVSSHADWEGLGEKRGVRPSCNIRSSAFSHEVWETNKRSTWHQNYEKSPASRCDSWENQGRRWDEPWGM